MASAAALEVYLRLLADCARQPQEYRNVVLLADAVGDGPILLQAEHERPVRGAEARFPPAVERVAQLQAGAAGGACLEWIGELPVVVDLPFDGENGYVRVRKISR